MAHDLLVILAYLNLHFIPNGEQMFVKIHSESDCDWPSDFFAWVKSTVYD